MSTRIIPAWLRVCAAVLLCAATPVALSACSKNGEEKAGAAAGGPGGGPPGKGGGRDRPVSVIATRAVTTTVVDRIEAIGNANAKEQVTLTATVTERVKSLNFQDGQFVRRGQVLAQMTMTEESADLTESRARLREANQQLERINALVQDGYATKSRRDQQVATRDALRAEAEGIQARMADRVIRAPFDGVVGLRRVSPGIVATAGTPIVTIANISQIKLDFTVPETFIGALKLGQPVQAESVAFPGELFTGQIDGIDPLVDPVTRSVTVRAVLPNSSGRIKPGMLMTVDIASNPRQMLMVPEQALTALREQQFVFRLSPGPEGKPAKVTRVPVVIGRREPGYVEILQGLSPGDLIVVEGTMTVRDGGMARVQSIRPGPASAAPQPAAADAPAEKQAALAASPLAPPNAPGYSAASAQ
jgi:membrane fusion protein, multidrug efflux system